MAKGRLTRGIVAGAIYGGAKAYTDELDYQQKVADDQAKQDRLFKQQAAMENARDEASFKRQQQVADYQQAKIDAQQAKLSAAMKTGAQAARDQGIDPSSAAGLRFIASALGDAGLASDAERYTNRATDMQRADDAYARQEALAKNEAERNRIAEARDNMRYNAMMAGITARGARGDGSDKDIPIGKYMRDVEGDVKDAFNLKRPSKLGDKQEEMNYGAEGVTLFHQMYDNAIKHGKDKREAVDIARDYALQNASFVRAAYRAGKPADQVFDIGIAAHDDAVAKVNAAPAATPAPAPTPTPTGPAAYVPAKLTPAAAAQAATLPPDVSPALTAAAPPPVPVAQPAAAPTALSQVKQPNTPSGPGLRSILGSAANADDTSSMANAFRR